MEGILQRLWEDLLGRFQGPMTFRLILQPLMAISFAFRDGIKDAKAGKPPYFWGLFLEKENARALLLEGWKAVARVFFFAIAVDLVYQILVFRWFYPIEALVVAILLAILPYVLLRGPANRLLRRYLRRGKK